MDVGNDKTTRLTEQVNPIRRSASVHLGDSSCGDDCSQPSFPEISSLIVAAGQHAWLALVLAVLVGSGFAYAAWKLVSPEFLATSFVHVRHRSDYLLSSEQSRAEDAAFVRAQESTVVLPQVLKRALEDPEVLAIRHLLPERNQSEWLASIIQAKSRGGSEVMTISIRHESPEIAQALTNAITKAYLFEVTTSAQVDRKRRKQELERLAKIADDKLNNRYQELQTLAETLGSGNLEALSVRDQIQLQGFREYAQRLRSIQLEKNQLEIQLTEAVAKERSEYEFSDQEIQYAIESHPDVILQQQRIADVDIRIREMAEVVRNDDSPRMMQLRQDRDYYEDRLQKTIEQLRPRIRDEMRRQRRTQLTETVQKLEQQLAIHEQEETFLKEMLAQMDPGLERNVGRQGVQLEMLRHEIQREEGVADNLWRSLEQLKIEEQAQDRVSLLEEAKLPTVAIRSKQTRAATAAGCVGICLVVFGIGWFEWRSCRIRHPRDFIANTRLRLFGIGSYVVGLPLLWRLKNARRDPITSGINEVAAQLILNTPAGRSLPSVMVSSAVQGEPRHLVALQLASALSRTGRRILLVDCESGNSPLVTCLGSEYKSIILGSDARRSDSLQWIRPTTQLNLDFAHVGGEGRSQSLASSRLLAQLLDRIFDRYDGIVVHGPAILTSPESVLLASQVECTLLAMVMGRSRWNLIAAAKQRLQTVGSSVLGAVMHVAAPSEQLGILPGTARQNDRARQDSTTDAATEEALARQVEELRQEVRNQRQPSKQEGDGAEITDSSSS